jgi:exodeoxyribonuclease V alpha subunit
MIYGIGSVYARKLVRAFGSQVFDVLEAEPHRVQEIAVTRSMFVPVAKGS